VTRTCSSLMIKEFNASHWIMSEAPDELNEALDQFFHSVESKVEHRIEYRFTELSAHSHCGS